MEEHKFNKKKTKQCIALDKLKAQKNIIPYKDGYKIEGYFGYVESYEEAQRVVAMFKRTGQ